MMDILNFFKKHPGFKIALIVLIVLFLLNTVIKFAIGVYFPWNREDWGFLPYTYWNENTELKGGEIVSYNGVEKVVVIPRNITSKYARSEMDGTKVVEIDDWAFGYLSPRQSETIEVIIVPEGIEKIGKFAFHDCENLKYLYIPLSVNSISHYAFDNLPEDVNIITLNPYVNELLIELGRQ